MAISPSDATQETIPGDPSHHKFADAESEFKQLSSRGAGQPYLVAVKLRSEPRTLHLRAYLKNASNDFAWGNLDLVPQEVKSLAAKTSQRSALAWAPFQSGGTAPSAEVKNALSQIVASGNASEVIRKLDAETAHALGSYLRRPGYGLFFDPMRNHDAWLQPTPVPEQIAATVDDLLKELDEQFPASSQGDLVAETLSTDPDEVEAFREQIENKNYAVSDSTATVNTRGSAQRAFAEVVKRNYGYRCAITGIVTKEFLVASHIVPWSKDQSIRLDPSNGICLSQLVDCAFEKGHLLIEDDLTIHIDWDRVGEDQALRGQLEPYDGQKLGAPSIGVPKPEYLRRRRLLVTPIV